MGIPAELTEGMQLHLAVCLFDILVEGETGKL